MGNKRTDEPENPKGQHGGARPGAGRPKGSMDEHTKFIRDTGKAFRQRVAKNADKLLNTQMGLARGEMNLYVKTVRGNKTITRMVDDPELVIKYLDGELEDDDNEYYYLATKSPDGKALDSLLDRTYGKAKLAMDITSDDKPLQHQPISGEVLAGFKEYMLKSTKSDQQKD